jgi:transposase-like protein
VNEHHYQRIDKGQSRRKYPAITPKSSGITTHRPLRSFSNERRAQIAAEVLTRYAHGEQVSQMAPEFETSDVTLYALLLHDHELEWKDLQTSRALARLERENINLQTAQDPLSLARARELVRSAQWELERLLNRIFGQKQEVTHTIKPEFNVILKQQDKTAIDGESTPVLPDPSDHP